MNREQKLERWAERIYSRYYGHLDDRRFKAQKVQEIFDWLFADSDAGISQSVKEWGEYDADEIAREAER